MSRGCRMGRITAAVDRRLEVRVLAGPTSADKRIDDSAAGVCKIRTVSGGHRQTVDARRRRDKDTPDRQGFPGCTKTRQQFPPTSSPCPRPRALHSASSTQSRWARKSPSADRPATSRWRPRSAAGHAGRCGSPRDRDARRRTPVPARRGPSAGSLPVERSGPWTRR